MLHKKKPKIDWCSPSHLAKTKPPVAKSPQGKLRIVDLFCGCGGLSLGVLEAAAILNLEPSIDFAVDINSKALSVYKANLAQYARDVQMSDVTKIFSSSSLLRKPTKSECALMESIDMAPHILFAGPPCQGHSDLNNLSRRFDPRNELYLIPVRAAALLRPKAVVIENVPTVVHSSEQVVRRARQALEGLGYETYEVTIDFTALGVPQSRKRHLLIGAVSGMASIVEYISEFVPTHLSLINYIEDIADEADGATDSFQRTTKLSPDNQRRIEYLFNEGLYDLPNHLRPRCHSEKTHSYKSMYGRLRPDTPSQTVTSGFGSMGQGRFVHPTRPRMITAHEAARIQGFPDYYSFAACHEVTALREMIGNAVPPALSFLTVMAFAEAGLLDD